MALLHVNFFSDVLGMATSMDVILPEQTMGQIGREGRASDKPYPTLYLLHGHERRSYHLAETHFD